MYFMPESPRWLAQRDQHEKALQVLARLHSNGDVHDPFVKSELAEIEAKIQWERQNPAPSYFTMLFGPERRRTWLGIGVVSLWPNSLGLVTDTSRSNSGNRLPESMCKSHIFLSDNQIHLLTYCVKSDRIMYYAVFLFQQAGIHGTQTSLLANGIQGAVLNVFTWPNMYWMDTWGRRKPMIIGAFGMAISMMLIGVIMKTKGPYATHGQT